MLTGGAAYADHRTLVRDEVDYSVRGYGPDARELELRIVNISARGLMARCDRELAVGARLRVPLPVVGVVAAEIRWALGGRIGCELDAVIDLADYYELLARMVGGDQPERSSATPASRSNR